MAANERFWEKVDKAGSCWLWTSSKGRDGYGLFWLDGRYQIAHRVSWAWRNGPIPSGLSVLHRCDVTSCVNPDHLFVGTQAENMADKARKGRAAQGEANGSSRLTTTQIHEIRGSRMTPSEIAARYGIDKTTVWKVRTRRTWRAVA